VVVAENITAVAVFAENVTVDVPMALIAGLFAVILFAVILFAVIWKTPTPKAKMAMEVATRRSEMIDAMTAFNTGFIQGCNPRKLKTLLENSNAARKRFHEANDKSN
jgi:ABC-type multidrug transport system fused ATPase/permease subunit